MVRAKNCYALIQIPYKDKKRQIPPKIEKTLMVISVINYKKGNGDFEIFMELIDALAISYNAKYISFSEILNKKFYNHLVNKRGFSPEGKNWVEKKVIYKN